MPIKPPYILFLLLAAVILLGAIVLRKENMDTNTSKSSGFVLSSDPYLYAQSPPTIPKNQILATKYEGDYYSLIASYDWDARVAWAVMMAESGGNPNAINSGDNHRVCRGSYGLFQMGCLHFGSYGLTESNWSDPEVNVRAAYLLWKERGWGQWGAYTNGSYKKFLH